MRILLVSQDFPPELGGIEQYSHQLASAFSEAHDVFVLAPTQPGARAFDATLPYTTLRYPVVHTSAMGMSTPVSIPVLAAWLRPDAVFHSQYATATGSLAAKKAGIIDGYHVAAHGRELRVRNLGPISPVLRKTLLKNATGLFPVSRYTGGLLTDLGLDPEKIHITPNGVNLSRFFPRDATSLREKIGVPDDTNILVSTCRLVPHKGMDVTIEAVSKIASKVPNLVYLVIGGGPDRGRLETLAKDQIESGRIRFMGKVSDEDLPVYLSMADVFVMPSRAAEDGNVEGFGLVYLEANACGTPVIGSPTGGVPDAIEEGKSGLLVPPKDSTALGNAICDLLSSPRKREALAKGGLERVKKFTWRHSADTILQHIASSR